MWDLRKSSALPLDQLDVHDEREWRGPLWCMWRLPLLVGWRAALVSLWQAPLWASW
ncbi:unnamed protein product [Trifolium pratense]|nr:unnamed protein product [Trifolium pratense]